MLGLAYAQRARETGDPSYYARSQRALDRALELDPKDALAVSGLGALALARHRFDDALALGRAAPALQPSAARHYGVIGDALVELGRYREAFAAFDRMDRAPPEPLLVRARLLRPRAARRHEGRDRRDEARGRRGHRRRASPPPGRTSSSASSTSTTAASPPPSASTGTRSRRFPGYPYAYDALAQALAARGQAGQAIRLERRAVDAIPLPQYVAALGDLYAATGKPASRAGSTPDRRDRAAAERERRARPTSSSRCSTSTTASGSRTRSRWRGAAHARAAVDRRRRRARLGADAQRPLRRGPAATRTGRSASAPRTR